MRRTLATLLVVAGLMLTGCTGMGAGDGDTPAAVTSSARTPNTPAPPRMLTGTQLKALLAPASGFPKGVKLDKKTTLDTGKTLQLVKPSGKQPCSRLNGTAWIDLANVGGVSFAQNTYVAKDDSLYAQEIDVFKGSAATKVMTNLRSVAKRCKTFPDTQTGTKVTVRTATAPTLGDEALAIRLTDPQWTGDTMLIAVRVSNSVVTVFISSTKGNSQTMANRLATYLTKRLTAAVTPG